RWIQDARENPEAFWGRAAEQLPWLRKWDRVFEWTPPTFRWFVGGQTNLAYNALDHHVKHGWGGHTALVYLNERGERRLFTYAQLLHEVERLAAALRGMGSGSVERVVVLNRTGEPTSMQLGRDITWEEFLSHAEGQSGDYVPMESNEPAYILATSGTTAKPKLAIHTHGGYQVHIHSMGQWVFDLQPTDVWWSTSDIGWVVGHSYIVYAPLIAGATTLAYEGALDHPGPEVFWQVVEEFGVTGVFTSPTAIRLLMKYGDEPPRQFDHSSLERVFSAGEVLNAPAWEWLQKKVLKDRVPVIDHMWQTETGGPIFGNPYGLGMLPIKPGSSGIPLPGIEPEVGTTEGQPCAP